jgi:glycosyltransferase involved in cell wall biosynthesis
LVKIVPNNSGEWNLNILYLAKNVTLCGRTGDAIHVREIVKQLAEKGNKIYLVGRDLQGLSEKKYIEYQESLKHLKENKNIEITLMRSKAKLSFGINRDYQALKQCLNILRNKKIDLLYSRSFNAYLEGFLITLYRIPLVLEINGLAFEERAAVLKSQNKLLVKFMKAVSRSFLNYTSSIIAVTNKIKTQLNEDYNVSSKKIYVVNNGVNEELFRPMPEVVSKIRKELKLGAKTKVICFVGAFDPWHGIDTLITATGIVIEKEPQTIFLMVGDGIMMAPLSEKVKKNSLEDNFRFTGRIPYENVPPYINTSNICVIPFPRKNTHLKDSSPLKLYEYLACGKPVVSTEVGGVAEVLSASGAGLLVRPDDPEALASGMIELLKDEKRQKLMGKKGRKYVVSNFTWKKNAQQVVKICMKALKV